MVEKGCGGRGAGVCDYKVFGHFIFFFRAGGEAVEAVDEPAFILVPGKLVGVRREHSTHAVLEVVLIVG